MFKYLKLFLFFQYYIRFGAVLIFNYRIQEFFIIGFIYYIFRLRSRFDFIVDCENGIPFFSPIYSSKLVAGFIQDKFDDYEDIYKVHFIAFVDEKTIWKQTYELVKE